ncbi:acyltransferase family protein [Rhodanobacter sp. C01]|uniref:acyltransferase family protein n=1 Tax=Rhodanobacter sp. C01 TaxID=1945856 RepID=UPI000987C003|nr:acyltransferase family protein [Rhodanobacter sp. C01]OOG45420.1 acyltransferase [Rhodanobacter sp. C01]
MDTRGYRLGYRSDIEGLRAIAILLVVAAHAKVSWLAGGFIGVDVFFVLSGYLITGLLLQEIDKTGHLRFLNFYACRLRRLLPALLLVLVCTCLVAAVTLAPGEQADQAVAAATASVWLSNIHFAFAKLDYFSPGAGSNLFLHTWSLGVEEQFYLIWPALLVWALGAWHGKGSHDKRLKAVMLLIAAISLSACAVMTRTAPQMAFYMMPLRAWQFATGALVWLYFNSPTTDDPSSPSPRGKSIASRCAGWLGLLLIVVSALWFDTNMAYPGWRSLLPTVGAAAIIAAGVRGADAGIARILSWSPLQAVGRVSYAWYLWHWPVLLLGGTYIVTDNPGYRAALVALSLLLAVASYRWVESPIRHQARWTVRPGVTVMVALVLMMMANVACISWFNATSKWLNSPIQQRYAKAHVDAPVIYAMGCDDWYHSDRVRVCAFGPRDAAHTVVLMGDSIGAQWFPAVAEAFNRPGWRLLVLTKSSCPMVDEPIFYPRIGRDYVECTTWRAHALQQIAAWRPDIVILGSVQTYDLNQNQWVEGTARLLKSISAATGHTYIVRGTPHLPFDGPNCLSSQRWLPWQHSQQGECDAPAFDKQGNDVYQWQQQAASRFGNVSMLDLNNAICPDGECHAERDGIVVFRDSQHMTASFVESLSGEFEHRLKLTYPLDQPTPAK